MHYRCASTLLALPLVVPVTAAAEAFTATGDSAAVGLDVTVITRELEISGLDGGQDVDIDGDLAGIRGYWQGGPGLRLEARALAGNADVEAGDLEDTESARLLEGRATYGAEIRNGDRAYTGLAYESLSVDGPRDAGDIDLRSWYVPAGYATAGNVADHWRAVATLEGRFVIAGTDKIDDIGGDDVRFDRRGGWGIAADVTFRSREAPFEVQPYVYWTEYATSQSETVNDADLRSRDGAGGAAGVRIHWVF